MNPETRSVVNGAPSTARKAKISAVVISYNRADLIQTCLRALAFADEVLVFDKSSTDGTAELARPLADRVTLVPWSPVVEDTRAAAVAACAHDWIVCVDDDECLSVEAAHFIQEEVDAPRASVFLLAQRHYILATHDERAYYWPEHQPRFFHRDAVSFRRTVHGGTHYAARDAFAVPYDQGVCIHHLSHRDTGQWIDKANRYTSIRDRIRVTDAGNDLRRFAHQHIDRYLDTSANAEAGSYPQAVGVLRALYDIIDRLKVWEEERGIDGAQEFGRICAALDKRYAESLPVRHRAGAWVDERQAGERNMWTPAVGAMQLGVVPSDLASSAWVETLRASLVAARAAFESAMNASRLEVADLQQAAAQASADGAREQAMRVQVERELAATLAETDRLRASSSLAQAATENLRAALGAAQEELRIGLNAAQEELQAGLNAAQQQVAAIRASSSWRVTAPLRAVSSRFAAARRVVQRSTTSQSRGVRGALRVLRAGWRLALGRPGPALAALRGHPWPPLASRVADAAAQVAEPARFLRYALNVHNIDVDVARVVPMGAASHRVICVSHVLPFPPRAGNEYRIHRMLSWMMSEGFDVVLLVCPLEGERVSPSQFEVAARHYPRLVLLQRDGGMHANFAEAQLWLTPVLPRFPRDFSQLVRQSSPQPSPQVEAICRAFCPDVLVEVVMALQEGFGAQAYLAEYVFMTRTFGLLPEGVLKLVDTHDVFSTKQAKVAKYGIEDGLALSAPDEAALLACADVVIGIQPVESRELVALAPHARVVTAGVDFAVQQGLPPAPGGQAILLVASGNVMNVKGLEDFLRFAWPLVRRDCPAAQLRVVGDVGQALGFAPQGVAVLGRVEDLAAAYAQADVVINPAVAGTGLKIKTIEALCHSRPVVTFPSGADGIGEVARQFLLVAHNWYEFARLLVQALHAPDAARSRMQGEVLASEFDPAHVYAELRKVLSHVD